MKFIRITASALVSALLVLPSSGHTIGTSVYQGQQISIEFIYTTNMRRGEEYNYIPFEDLFSANAEASLILPGEDNATVSEIFHNICTDKQSTEYSKCLPTAGAYDYLPFYATSSSPQNMTNGALCRPAGKAILRGVAENLCHVVAGGQHTWCHNKPGSNTKLITSLVVDADMYCGNNDANTMSMVCHVMHGTGFMEGRVYCHYLYAGDRFLLRDTFPVNPPRGCAKKIKCTTVLDCTPSCPACLPLFSFFS